MKAYPEVITAEVIEQHAHISDAEISTDIRDTEREIADYGRLMEAEREMAATHPNPAERRMADFRAGARPSQIADRENFVAFLHRLREARAVEQYAEADQTGNDLNDAFARGEDVDR